MINDICIDFVYLRYDSDGCDKIVASFLSHSVLLVTVFVLTRMLIVNLYRV